MENFADDVYILIVNWNGWRDTVECLESVFRISYGPYRVIVCDNGSHDGSIENIKLWADGHLDSFVAKDNPLRHLSWPPVRKPVKYVEYDRPEAERGGRENESDARLVLIRNGGNLGFAGGNNVGFKYVKARGDNAYIWILNNDVVVEKEALTSLVNRIKQCKDYGMCGSTLLSYAKPNVVQALCGGTYNEWFATTKHIGATTNYLDRIDQEEIENKVDYIVGASMLITNKFLSEVGMMNEDYFLYFEEIDWAVRAKGRFSMAYAVESLVFHKEGQSIGSSSDPNKKSLISDYYGIRNRFYFTKKFYPWAIFTVYLSMLGVVKNRLVRGQWDRIRLIFKAIFSLSSVSNSGNNS